MVVGPAPDTQQLDVIGDAGMSTEQGAVDIDGQGGAEEVLAIKRTYQPHTKRRKKKHGARARRRPGPAGRSRPAAGLSSPLPRLFWFVGCRFPQRLASLTPASSWQASGTGSSTTRT